MAEMFDYFVSVQSQESGEIGERPWPSLEVGDDGALDVSLCSFSPHAFELGNDLDGYAAEVLLEDGF